MRLNKRIADLEAKQFGTVRTLDHLTDEELEAYSLGLIEQFQALGIALPDDWREQYARSEIRFLEWLEREAKEKLQCET